MNNKIKDKLAQTSSRKESAGVEKNRIRRSEPWLKHYSSQIAMRILAILEEKKMSQEQLSRLLGVSSQQVSKIVKGKENLTLKTIYNISNALEFDLLSFPDYKYSTEILFRNLNPCRIVKMYDYDCYKNAGHASESTISNTSFAQATTQQLKDATSI